MVRFLHGIVPDRPSKPRLRGLTHAIDQLVPVSDIQVPQIFEFVDIIKIGWGLPALLNRTDLARRLAYYHRLKVLVSSGGTLTEYAMMKKAYTKYLTELNEVGFDIVELSESRLNLKASALKRAIAHAHQQGLQVALKVGRKNPKEQLSSQELKRKLEESASFEVMKVVIEGGDGYGVTLFGRDAELRDDTLDLICSTVERDRLIFEAPLRHQRGALIIRLGPDANIGAVPLHDVPALETQRLGLMSGETFGLVREAGSVRGGPAAKFVHFLITTRGQLSQADIVRISSLPRRTVQAALENLKIAGLVLEEQDSDDLRRRLYRPLPGL